MTALADIEAAAAGYAQAVRELQVLVAALDADMAGLKRQHLPLIKGRAAAAAEAKAALLAQVRACPALFAKPRTRILHGIKVGWSKSKGRLEWADAAQVIRLIRRHLADQAETLIKVSEAPIKTAIGRLPAADLKRIGVSVIDTGDQPVVELTDNEIERLVDALLCEPAADAEAS